MDSHDEATASKFHTDLKTEIDLLAKEWEQVPFSFEELTIKEEPQAGSANLINSSSNTSLGCGLGESGLIFEKIKNTKKIKNKIRN